MLTSNAKLLLPRRWDVKRIECCTHIDDQQPVLEAGLRIARNIHHKYREPEKHLLALFRSVREGDHTYRGLGAKMMRGAIQIAVYALIFLAEPKGKHVD